MSSISRDSVQTLVSSVAASVISIVTGIAIAKWLGPVGKGAVSSLQLLQAALAAITGGAGAAITHHLTKRKGNVSQLVRPLAVLLLCTSLAAWLCQLVWALVHGFTPYLVIFALVVPACIIQSWQGYIYMGLSIIRNMSRQRVGGALLALVLVTIAVRVLNLKTVGAVGASALTTILMALPVLVAIRRFYSPSYFALSNEETRSLSIYGGKSALSGIVGFLISRVDSILVVGLLGVAGFGIYSVAVALGQTVYQISLSIATGATHRIGSESFQQSAELTARSIRVSLILVLAASAVVFVAGPPVIDAVYGLSFHRAGDALRILLCGNIWRSVSQIFSSFFVYQLGRPLLIVYFALALVAIESMLWFLLTPRYSLNGAAAASTLTYLCEGMLMTGYFCRITGLRFATVWLPNKGDVQTILGTFRRFIRGTA